MKKLLPVLFALHVTCYMLHVTISLANGWTPACDPCGFCVGGQKPTDWDQCSACLAQEGKNWTILGCIPNSPGGFIQIVLQTAVKMIGGIAFLAFLYGGFLLLTSSGEVQKITQGKTILMSAIVGLLMVVFAVFLLRLIGLEILKIPGFGE